MARLSLCKKAVDVDANTVSFNFTNGKQLVTDINALPVEMVHRLALHGLSAKCGDAYADAGNPSDAYELALAVYENLLAGEWSGKRESTGGDIVQALSNLTGKPLDECRDAWKALPEATQKLLAKEPNMVAEVATIRANKAMEKAATATGGGINLLELF